MANLLAVGAALATVAFVLGGAVIWRVTYPATVKPPSPDHELRLLLGAEPPLPFVDGGHVVEWTATRHPGLLGQLTFVAHPSVLGTVWSEATGDAANAPFAKRGFGFHTAREVFRLANPSWILVHADSGLWLVESETLAKRWRVKTKRVEAADVSIAADRLVYAECDSRSADTRPIGQLGSCELVIRRLSTFVEIVREPIPLPRSVHLSVDGTRVAIVDQRVTLRSTTEAGREKWSFAPEPSMGQPMDAIPIGETRVGYVTTTGNLGVWTAGEAASVWSVVADHGTYRLGFGSDVRGAAAKTLVYSPVTDRLAFPVDSRSVDGAARGAPISRALNDAYATIAIPPFHRAGDAALTRVELDKTSELGNSLHWGVDKVGSLDTIAGGATFGVVDGIVIRIDRHGVARSVDFDTMGDVHSSTSRFDVVLWASDGRTTANLGGLSFWRMKLDFAELDAAVEPLQTEGVGTSNPDHALVFDDGARAFVFEAPGTHGSLARMPRNAPLLDSVHPRSELTKMPTPFVHGDDAWGRVETDVVGYDESGGRIVVITPNAVNVIDQEVPLGGVLSWSPEPRCWSVVVDDPARPLQVCPARAALPEDKPGRKSPGRLPRIAE